MSNSTYLPASADSLARLHTAEAVGCIVDTMRNAPKATERLRAAEIILDRGHGRAVQAVISVPARQAVALKLAGMSDSELLQIANRGRGSTPEKGSPHAEAARGGTILEPNGQVPETNAQPPLVADFVDAEYEVADSDEDIDPCS